MNNNRLTTDTSSYWLFPYADMATEFRRCMETAWQQPEHHPQIQQPSPVPYFNNRLEFDTWYKICSLHQLNPHKIMSEVSFGDFEVQRTSSVTITDYSQLAEQMGNEGIVVTPTISAYGLPCPALIVTATQPQHTPSSNHFTAHQLQLLGPSECKPTTSYHTVPETFDDLTRTEWEKSAQPPILPITDVKEEIRTLINDIRSTFMKSQVTQDWSILEEQFEYTLKKLHDAHICLLQEANYIITQQHAYIQELEDASQEATHSTPTDHSVQEIIRESTIHDELSWITNLPVHISYTEASQHEV